MPHYDVIVIGAGGMGSAVAYYLSQAGQKVLLLEQFALDHQRGSSNDHTRIIRYAYRHPAYIQLMRAAYPLWHALEDAAGEPLYIKTGGLDFGLPDDPRFRDTRASLEAMHIPYEQLTPAEAQRRYPQFQFDEAWHILYQADYGLLAAARCVQAHIRLARQHGAVVHAETPVLSIHPSAQHVTIKTPQATYEAARLVLTAGAWTSDLMAQLGIELPLQPMRVQLAYFKPANLDAFSPGQFPVFISHLDHPAPYGIPSFAGTGVKVALHGGEIVPHVSAINYTPDEAPLQMIRAFARRCLPAIADAPLGATRICLYTMTPDEDFVIDVHPEYPSIVYATPCSGHGFKFSTLVGSILCDLVLEGQTPHDISLFRAARFKTKTADATTETRQ